MSRKKSLILLILVALHAFLLVSIAALVPSIIINIDDLWNADYFLGMFYVTVGAIILTVSLDVVAIIYSRARYDAQFIKHQDNLIIENKKREIRLLIIASLLSVTGLSVFPIIVAYIRSGLNKTQLRAAKKQIALTNVELILEQPAIADKINSRPELKRKIKSLNSIRNSGIDTPHHVNGYIMKLLREEGINFRFPYNDREIYYVGTAYKR